MKVAKFFKMRTYILYRLFDFNALRVNTFICFLLCCYMSNAQSNIEIRSLSPVTTLTDENIFDLATSSQGKEVELDFEIKNTGNDTIFIQDVSSTCSCNVVEVVDNVLKPNESGILKITYNPRQKQGLQMERIALMLNVEPYKQVFYLTSEVVDIAELQSELPESDLESEIAKKFGIDINVFPNPVSELVNVSISMDESEKITFDLVNVLGHKLYSREVLHSEKVTITTDHLVGGMYYLFFTDSNGNTFKKSILVIGQ